MDWTKQKSSSPIDSITPCRYEPEGSCRSNSRPSSREEKPNLSGPRTPSDNSSPPACLQWAQSLHMLLQDSDGVKLFLQYLESEGQQHADALHFWFACEGLKNEGEREKIQRLVKVIYNTFVVKSALPISVELRREIAANLKSTKCIGLLDKAQAQIEQLINNTTYPNFLKSDMYLQYLQSVQNPCSSGEYSSESSSSSSSVSAKDLANLASGGGTLPTLHEDMEFVINPSVQISHGTGSVSTGYQTPNLGAVRLTKDILLMSQKHRAIDVRPKSEAFAGVFMYRSTGAHAAYNSYNPVSRQDSELQSISSHSDIRTESDTMSLTDSSIDGRSVGRTSRRKAVMEARLAKQSAALNRETHIHQTFIPRTQRLDSRQCQPLEPQHFAAILIEKLENVKRKQDNMELLDRKLKESDSMSSLDDKARMSAVQSRELANAIREKLQVDDDNDQDILDQHVSRVFSPAVQSPGIASPRPHYPPRNRSSSKRTLTDLTDSGISVISDTPPIKDNRVLAWLMDAKDSRTCSTNYTGSLGPAQPFVADPNMPPPPRPNTAIQLEEARRRLLEDDPRSKLKPRSSNKYYPDMTQSGQSTLRKSTRGQRPSYNMPAAPVPEDYTTVVFSFCDEQFPYRSKIPGTQITLKQFKEYLPKKGNYRFFFKTVSEELDNQVIQEEVSNDADVLPLWEGKIMAQVKPSD